MVLEGAIIGGLFIAYIIVQTYWSKQKPQIEIDEINQKALDQALGKETDE